MNLSRPVFTRLVVASLLGIVLPMTCVMAQTATPAKPAAKPAGATTTLTIKVDGVRNVKGKINVALYKDAIGFPMDPSGVTAAKQVDIDPQTLTATAVFETLPQGVYAAAVLHDEDLSGQMSFDTQGMPTKGYGISNNPPFRQAAPTPDEAKFTADKPESNLSIKMIYFQ